MPTLKDLHCSIELSNSGQPLQEMGTVYGDACVETFISVPKERHKFTIHLSSTNFIAPGIAMYVFIDGVYQCNRNRQNLEPRMPPDRRSLVNFRVRQKEEIQKDGSMVAREWTFERPHSRPPNILEDIGCIEVVVLRCDGSRDAKTTADMNLDGAADYPDYRSDRSRRSRRTAYDDRDPIVGPASNRHVPPPFPLYHSPYAETVRSQEGAATQYWKSTDGGKQSPFLKDHFKRVHHQRPEPVGPDTRPRRDIPAPAFHYGSGPLPPRSVAETQRDLIAEAISSELPKSAPTMDPTLLEKIVADAVKRGVEESRKHASQGSRRSSRAYEHDTESSSQIPGAWPTSPTHPEQSRARSTHHDRARDSDGGDSTWKGPERKPRSTRSKADTRVAWDQELGWDNASKADGWDSDTASDSWDTDEPWSNKRHDGWKDIRRSKSRPRITRSPSPSRIASFAFNHKSTGQRARHARSRKARAASRWREDRESSEDEKDGWTHIAAPSDSSTSSSRSDSTLKPSHSRSQVQSSGRTAKRHTSRRSEYEQLQLRPQHIETPWHTEPLHPPSVLITNAQPPPPTLAPISHFPSSVHPQPQHPATQPAAPVLAPPPPTWDCATAAPSRWNSGSTYVPPAPFSSVGMGHARARRRSGGGSSWGGGVAEMSKPSRSSKHGEKKKEKKKEERAQTVWGGEGEGRGEGAWGEGEAVEWDGEGEGWEDGGEGGDADAEKEWGGGDTDTEKGWGSESVETEHVGWETPEERGDAWGSFGAEGADGTSGTSGTQGAGWGWGWDTHKHFDVDNANANDIENANANVNPDTNDNDTWTPTPKPSTLKRPKPTKKPNTHPAAAPPLQQYPLPTPTNPTLPFALPRPKKTPKHHPTPSTPRTSKPHPAILPGTPTPYGHPVGRPCYVDRVECPYAVFRFRGR